MGRGAVLVVAAMVLASCGSPFPGHTLGQQVHSWATTTGLAASLGTLRSDARRIAQVEARHDPAGVRTDCDVLVNDALGANQNLPSPDATLTRILSSAYASASVGGRHCLSAAAGNAALLRRSALELATAASGYVKAEARLDALDAIGPRSS
ncbi:MAG TPA: hypothetical protein VII76_12875 [Acidimicrobiales bacterium]